MTFETGSRYFKCQLRSLKVIAESIFDRDGVFDLKNITDIGTFSYDYFTKVF